MGGQPARNLTDRELRALDLEEFLALVQDDIQHLDHMRQQRRRTPREQKPDPPLESLPLFPITCCGKRLGAFPLSAQVRCPFCAQWHRLSRLPGTKEHTGP